MCNCTIQLEASCILYSLHIPLTVHLDSVMTRKMWSWNLRDIQFKGPFLKGFKELSYLIASELHQKRNIPSPGVPTNCFPETYIQLDIKKSSPTVLSSLPRDLASGISNNRGYRSSLNSSVQLFLRGRLPWGALAGLRAGGKLARRGRFNSSLEDLLGTRVARWRGSVSRKYCGGKIRGDAGVGRWWSAMKFGEYKSCVLHAGWNVPYQKGVGLGVVRAELCCCREGMIQSVQYIFLRLSACAR